MESAEDFGKYDGDGICGLGFKTLSNNVPTFMDNLKEKGLISKRMFSFYLSDYRMESSSLSELMIDGYDPKYMVENFTFASVIDYAYWAVKIDGVKLGN